MKESAGRVLMLVENCFPALRVDENAFQRYQNADDEVRQRVRIEKIVLEIKNRVRHF